MQTRATVAIALALVFAWPLRSRSGVLYLAAR